MGILTLAQLAVFAQNCSQQLEDAKRAYYNGQFREVEPLLEGCFKQLPRNEQSEAYKLLTDTYLLLGNNEKASQFIYELLSVNPYYTTRPSDLSEFQQLHNNIGVKTKFTYGISIGFLRSDYIIMRHQSYAGQTVEPADYDEIPGISLGFSGDYRFYGDFYANVGLLYSQRSMKQREEILEYQEVASYERDFYLDIPIQLRYIVNLKRYKPFLGGGYAGHFLLHSRGDLDHVPLAPDFPSVIGVPELVDDYNLTDQRRRITHNWLVSGGVILDFQEFWIELKATYQLGLNNQVNTDTRFKDQELIEVYAFVPDDYRIDSYSISIGLFRNNSKPNKR